MSEWGSSRRGQGAWCLAVLAVVFTTASLSVDPQLDVGLVLALDVALLCLSAHLGIVRAAAPTPARVRLQVRTAVTADAPPRRESQPGVPGHAWPRAPGRRPL